MHSKLDAVADFMLELDKLKSVNRQSYISSGLRRENSAEHSWHLAMAVWVFAEYLKEEYDILRLIQMALVHDIGEIHAGDTFIFSAERDDAAAKERSSIELTAAHDGNSLADLATLWEEQETGSSKETLLLKALDRFLPFLLNIKNQGGTWRKFNIKRSQVIESQKNMAAVAPSLHRWILDQIDIAVEKNWLLDL